MSVIFNPLEIERELVTLERQLSPTETRTTLYNLVIFSLEQDQTEIERALSVLLGRRPARIINIQRTERELSSIHVSARCYPDRENRGVCFQEVVISNGRDGVGSAVGSWAPLVIRDIPVYLWWMDRLLPSAETFRPALEHADKVILSTSKSEELGEPFDDVLAACVLDCATKGMPIADISWRMLSPLRVATARLFDREDLQPLMYEIQHLDIRGGTKAELSLFASWLAFRLQWSRNGSALRYRDRDGRDVSIDHRSPGPVENGMSIRFVFNSYDEATLRTGASGVAEYLLPGEPPIEIRSRIPSVGEILMEEMDYLYHDYLFIEVVRNLGQS